MPVRYKDVFVTKAMAKKFLATNIEYNRNPKPGKQEEYTTDMNEGNWERDTGETVKVTPEGKMIDGQNRMWALLNTDAHVTGVWMTIAYGVPETNVLVVDSGAPRSFADNLKLHQVTNRFIAGSLVRRVILWEAGYKMAQNRSAKSYVRKTRPTRAQMMNRYKKDRAVFDAASARGMDVKKLKLGNSTIASQAYFLFYAVDPQQTHVFFDQLVSGANLPEVSPVLFLRNRLTKTDDMLDMQLAMYISAWNRWRNDEAVHKLQPLWRGELTNDNFPEPK